MPLFSTLITLPEDFATSALGYVGGVFTDLAPFIVILIALPLAFWGIKKVISLFRMRA